LVSPGSWFLADPSVEDRDLFFRATFAAAESAAMTEAIKRFGVAIRKVFKLDGGCYSK